MRKEIESVEDKGFQGLQKLHANSTIPIKASKNHKLRNCAKIISTKEAVNRVIPIA